jgi:hypothetical protein
MKLRKEQEDILLKLIAAEHNTPNGERENFFAYSMGIGFGDQWVISHPGLHRGANALHSDIVALEQHGFITVSRRSEYDLSFVVSSAGIEYFDSVFTKLKKLPWKFIDELIENPTKTIAAAIAICVFIAGGIGVLLNNNHHDILNNTTEDSEQPSLKGLPTESVLDFRRT